MDNPQHLALQRLMAKLDTVTKALMASTNEHVPDGFMAVQDLYASLYLMLWSSITDEAKPGVQLYALRFLSAMMQVALSNDPAMTARQLGDVSQHRQQILSTEESIQ